MSEIPVLGRMRRLNNMIESFKEGMGTAIGELAMQALLNHPYPPGCGGVRIPDEIEKDEKLARLWPQIEQHILEWRKLVYLMGYVMRTHIEEITNPSLELLIDNAEKALPFEQTDPHVKRVRDATKILVQQSMRLDKLVRAYEDQATAYAQENNDLDTMEWYGKNASRYLPSPSVMIEKLQRVPNEIAAILSPLINMDGKQVLHHEPKVAANIDWGCNAIWKIRMASSSLLSTPPSEK